MNHNNGVGIAHKVTEIISNFQSGYLEYAKVLFKQAGVVHDIKSQQNS